MPRIRGRLKSVVDSNYNGHQLLISFLEKVEIVEQDERSLAHKPSPKHATNPVLIWKPSEQRASVESNGAFVFTLPDTDLIRGPLAIRVLAPDGDTLTNEEYAVEELGPEIILEVQPKQFPRIEPSSDPFLGKRVKITGRVLDETSVLQVANRQVLLYARPEAPNGAEYAPLATAKTDAQGYFSTDYPRGKYVEAYGIVAATDGKPVPIPLTDGAFPRHVVLVVKVPEKLKAADECDCDSDVPRTPDSEDLTNSSSTYSVDLVGGKCVDFTVPNRSLEEFSFFSVVRTTEPEIKGLTLSSSSKLTYEVLSAFGGLLGAVPLGHMQNAPAKSPTEPVSTVSFGTIAKEINPSVLKALASDPDSFTPSTLINAEKASAFQDLSGILETLSKKVPGRSVVTAANPVDWDDTPTFYQATTIAHGHLLHFKQVWRADGYSLGDLLYSLPLAPCQKKQIAVIDWDRRERGARAEQLEAEEQLDAFLSRDRDISEIVKSTLKEAMRGGSESETDSFSAGGGLGFGAEGSLGIVSGSIGGVFGLSGGSGSASSSAWQKSSRTAAASSAQHLQDTTMQSASSVRSQRATVVQTVRQGESMRVQTETVANHNHCHAITVEYFEVLRHLRVDVELSDVQECLFIPLLMSKFDYAKALRWRESLTLYMRNRSLRAAFGAIERYLNNYEGSDLPAGRYSEETIEYLDGELRVAFYLTRPKDTEDEELDNSNWTPFAPFLISLGGVDSVFNLFLDGHSQVDRDQIFQSDIAPHIAEAFVQSLTFYIIGANGQFEVKLDATLVSNYSPNTPLYVSLRPLQGVPPVSREWITRFEIRATEPLGVHSKAVVNSGSVRYRTKHLSHFLFRDSAIKNDLLPGDPVQVPTFLDRQELRNPRDEDKELRKRLIAHLNEHIEYYHKVIWWRMDKERRYMLLDGFIAPNAGGRSVASVVENKLISVVGNCLVMPVARGFHLDPTFSQNEEDPVDLLEHYAPTTPIPPMRISIPTRGVFAEAVMGSCNSCEKKDDARFWRFEESPCGDEPTPIQPISTESRRADPGNLQAKDLPAPIVAFQNAPPAPDPTGMASALRLLGLSNLFPNITGLDQNQKNALAALTSSFDTTKFMAAQAAALANEEAKLAQQKGMADNVDKTMQVMDKFEQDGTLSKEDKAKHANAILDKLHGGNESQPRLTDNQELMGAARSAIESGKQDVGISTPSENMYVNASSTTLPGVPPPALIEHLAKWQMANLDSSTGKPELHIDQKIMEQLRDQVTTEPLVRALAEKAADTVKFQLHRSVFTSALSLPQLVDLFNDFQNLIDPDVVECQKKIGAPNSLSIGDEFRWIVSPISSLQGILSGIAVRFTMPVWGAISGLIASVLAKRRFDVRIVRLNSTATSFDFSAQTLTDHPYAGMRTWRISTTDAPGRYALETAEFNTFPWLIDFVAESVTKGEDARRNWEFLLTRYIHRAAGVVVNPMYDKGFTVYGTADTIQSTPEVMMILNSYKDLAEEFNRVAPPPTPVIPI
ncbi:MAG: hypothetical protein U0X20_00275 [Caldilineaceae bacterium]